MADLPAWLQAVLWNGGVGPMPGQAMSPNAATWQQGLAGDGGGVMPPPQGLLAQPDYGGLLGRSGGLFVEGRSVAPGQPIPVDASVDNAADPNTPIRQTASPAGLTQGRSADTGIVGTPASGTTEASSPGFIESAGKVLGSLYGAGGPGDSLIQLGAAVAHPEGWAKGVSQMSQNMGANQLNQARLQAFKLQMAQQQAGQTATYNYLKGKGLSHEDATAAISAAAAGQPELLKNFIQQYSAPDKFQLGRDAAGNPIAFNPYEPEKSKTLGSGAPINRPLTDPAEREAFGIPRSDTTPFVLNTATNKPESVGKPDPQEEAAMGMTKDIASNFPKSREGAIASTRTIEAIARQRQALDNGAITGSGAEGITNARAFFGQMLGITDPKVIASQQFDAASTSKAAELAKALSNSGHTTNADIMMGKVMAAANRGNYEEAIRAVMDAQELLARESLNRHNADIDAFKKVNPKAAAQAEFYKVPEPDLTPYQKKPDAPSGGDPLTAARAAIARGAPRQAVMNRLIQNGINPAGL